MSKTKTAKLEPKPGDAVVFFGRRLEVTEVDAKTVTAADAEGLRLRSELREKLVPLRAEETQLKGDPAGLARMAEIRAEVQAMDKAASEGIFVLGLRKDLLEWWEEEGYWFSPGRLLSDAQRERFITLMGKKPLPSGEKVALRFLATAEG